MAAMTFPQRTLLVDRGATSVRVCLWCLVAIFVLLGPGF